MGLQWSSNPTCCNGNQIMTSSCNDIGLWWCCQVKDEAWTWIMMLLQLHFILIVFFFFFIYFVYITLKSWKYVKNVLVLVSHCPKLDSVKKVYWVIQPLSHFLTVVIRKTSACWEIVWCNWNPFSDTPNSSDISRVTRMNNAAGDSLLRHANNINYSASITCFFTTHQHLRRQLSQQSLMKSSDASTCICSLLKASSTHSLAVNPAEKLLLYSNMSSHGTFCRTSPPGLEI